jgi:hypothetical protein
MQGAIPAWWGSRVAVFGLAWICLDAAIAVYLYQDGVGPASRFLLLAALIAAFVACLRPLATSRNGELAALMMGVVLAQLIVRAVVAYRAGPPPPPGIQVAAAIALLAVLGSTLAVRRWPGILELALLATIAAGLGTRALVVLLDIAPTFDVPLIQMAAGEAVLDGESPYLTRVYSGGYPYLPVASLAAAAGLVVGDARWTSVLADLVSCAAVIGIAGFLRQPRVVGLAGSAMWAWHSGALYVTWQGFPEPVLIAFSLLAMAILCSRAPAWVAGAAMGLAVATKQFGAAILVTALAMGPRGRDVAAVAGATALAVILPFAVSHPVDFVNGTLVSLAAEPGRPHALNLSGLSLLAVPLALLGTFLALRGWQHPLFAWSAAASLLLLAAFAFNPIAFVNYYATVLGLMLPLFSSASEPAPGRAGPEAGWL